MLKRILYLIKTTVNPFGILSFATGITVMIVYMVLANFDYDPLNSGYMVLLLYLCIILVGSVIIRFIDERKKAKNHYTAVDGSFTAEILARQDIPVLMCTKDGKIIWMNKSFQTALRADNMQFKGQPLSSVISYAPEVLLNADKFPDGVDGVIENRTYKVKGYNITAKNGNEYLALVWIDRTEVNELIEKMDSERTLIANIKIDNLEDLLQFVEGSYREVYSQVDTILSEWADSVNGFIKEYQSDRYIFLFDAKYLEQFTEEKFSILEKIREIRVGESRTPVTVSIGISDPQGSLEERLKSAAAYLDTALQRGGDQAVVKIGDKISYYGGVTKTVQKRTKIRARVIAGEVLSLIDSSSNVLIMGHKNADYDSFGSCVGMGIIARMRGADCKIIINEQDPNLSKCIDKAKKIQGFENIFTDGITAQDLIRSDSLLIIVDANNPYQFESRDVFENSHKVVFIDHHRLASKFEVEPAISYIEPSASSACELITELIEQILPEGGLSKDEAELLYAGIALDTKKFTVNSGTKTFSAAMYLRNCGADPMAVNQQLFATDLTELTQLSGFERKIKIYRTVTAISVNEKDSLTPEDDKYAAMAADKLLTLEGVKASFTICKINDCIRVKARSNGSVNVQLIIEKLGGGGHFDQAATVIGGSDFEEVCTKLKEAIDTVLDSISPETSEKNKTEK